MNDNALGDKATSLADRMNQLTAKLELSEELIVQGDDIVDFVEEKTKNIVLHEESSYADIMNISVMAEDFQYIRSTLRETTDNARRVQNSITLDLLGGDNEAQASMVASFAELSKSITDAQKLYVMSYKEMSATLLNLDKINKNEKAEGSNHLHIHGTETVSTVDIIKQLKDKKLTPDN